jgi:hypothetical protein
MLFSTSMSLLLVSTTAFPAPTKKVEPMGSYPTMVEKLQDMKLEPFPEMIALNESNPTPPAPSGKVSLLSRFRANPHKTPIKEVKD